MPRPFVAYLRVYEPLSAFDTESMHRLELALKERVVDPADAGMVEREMWLRAQLATPAQLLPGGDVPDRSGAEDIPPILTLRAEDVPSGADSTVADEPLLCPLDVRPRAAAALIGFLGNSTPALRQATLGAPDETVRGQATTAMAELSGRAVHVVSSTWTVPLPWFTLVEPEGRQVSLAPRDDPTRRVYWRVAMADARRRAARAYAAIRKALGEDGPARMVRETGRWLEQFHPHSAVELDYGGLAQLLDDSTLLADTSADDVHHALRALEENDADEVADRYARLQEFWDTLASAERLG